MEVITIDLTQFMTPEQIAIMNACSEVESKIRKVLEDCGFTTHVEIWVNPTDTTWVEMTLKGDWKHVHIRLNNIMKAHSYEFLGEEDDELGNYEYEGTDYYCSTHIFRIAA
jgi:hypothetical protein